MAYSCGSYPLHDGWYRWGCTDGADGDGDASCWDTDDDGCTDGRFCQSTPYFLLEGKLSKRKFDSYDL